MDKDFVKLKEIIDSVKAANDDSDIELLGDRKAFDSLIAAGFPLENYRHQEILCDESKIFIIPCAHKYIKVYFEGE